MAWQAEPPQHAAQRPDGWSSPSALVVMLQTRRLLDRSRLAGPPPPPVLSGPGLNNTSTPWLSQGKFPAKFPKEKNMFYCGPQDLSSSLSDVAIDNPTTFLEGQVLWVLDVLCSLLLVSDRFPGHILFNLRSLAPSYSES